MITIKCGRYTKEDIQKLQEIFEMCTDYLIETNCDSCNSDCSRCKYAVICDDLHHVRHFLLDAEKLCKIKNHRIFKNHLKNKNNK